MFKFDDNKLSVAEIWQSTFGLYKQTFSKVWYLVLIMMLIGSIPNFFLGQAKTPLITSGMVIFLILSGILGLYLSAIILHRIYNLITDPNFKLRDSLIYALSRYLIILASVLAIYFILLMSFAILLLPIAVFPHQLAILLIGIWGIFAIFVVFLLMFNIPYILFEEEGWITALKSSFKLVWGNWWRTFAVFLAPFLILIIIQILTQTLIKHVWANVAVTSLVMVLFVPFLQSLILVQFKDLKLRQ